MMVHVWFATSTDPIHHMKKMGKTIWTSVHVWLHEQHYDPYRKEVIHNQNSKSLTHRWYTIQEATNKYCVFYKQLQF